MHFRNAFLIILTVLLLSACTVIKTKMATSVVKKSVAKSALFNSHFTGFVLYDPKTKQYLQEYNADKYFAPASNTKLFTFYSGLKILGNSVPALKYVINEDSLIFWGTGDPTFLHPDFSDQPVLEFLQNTDKDLYYATGNFQDTHYGAGWAWDDYSYYYQTERSAMPIYGNTVNFVRDSVKSEYEIVPPFFNDFSDILDQEMPSFYPNRSLEHNIFPYYPDSSKSDRKNRIPFKVSDELLVTLLMDTLKKPVNIIPYKPRESSITLYSEGSNKVYAMMLKVSDNFLAEQILYMCAAEKGDTLNSSRIRNYMITNHLDDLPSPPVWKDGSGLSRYNLFTPRSMVVLLEKIKQELPESTLLALLPVGGIDGTLKEWYKSETGEPYVFAKTGTFSNNHALSGFIRTKTGKLLTFSFMHNNYNSPSTPVKLEMEKTLRLIRDKY
ncbi:D-alanyl-D-alanine carboxypeptidase [Reichenbachiella sp. MALMAid0571]|uniref:D-alanyl-D-alanine carboxypeptidase/D-alanyl-D-alanine-endopeptidase n=1 Tax=Reichenbachiella sp. MALMAid0571 TaxID=3143939 RepID=UPI0032DEC610